MAAVVSELVRALREMARRWADGLALLGCVFGTMGLLWAMSALRLAGVW